MRQAMQYDNPAARLLSVLTDGRNIGPAEPCRKAWAGLLNTQKDDQPLLISRIGKLMSLPQEIIDRTKELYPNQRPTWNHWSSQVNAGFSAQNLNGQWQTFIQHFDDHTLTYLSMSAELLQAKSTIAHVDLDKLIDLRNDINDLLNDVLGSQIAPEFKKYVVHHLRKILISIDEYSITGAIPILDAVESTIGHAYLDKEYRTFLKNTELGAKIMETLAATANIVTVAVGIPQLAYGLTLLTSGG
jgi:hypothetical protein